MLCYFRYRLTKIAVDSAAGPYQNYTVVFLGSEKGIILKFLARTGNTGFLNDSLFLEEINVYNPEKCVSDSLYSCMGDFELLISQGIICPMETEERLEKPSFLSNFKLFREGMSAYQSLHCNIFFFIQHV